MSDHSTTPVVAGFEHGYAKVNGITLHYVAGGAGKPLVLLPGWSRTWWQFHKVMPALAERYRVIAVDLRGMGESDKPAGGYDKKTMASDIHQLVRTLGYEEVAVAGEDIGSMVAFAFAANHPEATTKIAIWEPGHPDETWRTFPMLPAPGLPHLWWFAFNQVEDLPERLLAGRFRLLVDYMIDLVGTPPGAIDERDREIYASAYDAPGAVSAANRWYQAFGQDIEDAEKYPVLAAPVLAIGGIYFPAVRALIEGRAADVTLVEFAGAGHYLAEERPDDLVRELTEFLG